MNDESIPVTARRGSHEPSSDEAAASLVTPAIAPPPRSRLAGRLFAFAAIIAIIAGTAWYVTRPPAPQTAAPTGRDAPIPVAIAPAMTGTMPVTLRGLGTVTPLATVTVRPQISGQLMRIAFTEGQRVAMGDLLAVVDPRPYEAALKQAEGQLLRSQALLQNARLDLSRYERLVAQDSAPIQQRDTQAALVRQYEGDVKANQAEVERARLDLSYCYVSAPVGGRVGLRQVDVGNYVETADANGIVVITQMRPISVLFTLPEDTLPEVRRQLLGGTPLPVTAFDRTAQTRLAEGVLTSIDNQVDPATGTLRLRGEFPNADESLFPNQFVNIELQIKVLKDVVLLPSASIQRGTPGTFVYVLRPDSTVTVRPVTLGPGDGTTVVAVSGIAAGEQVVVDGIDRLRDGRKVMVSGPAPDGRGEPSAPSHPDPAAAAR